MGLNMGPAGQLMIKLEKFIKVTTILVFSMVKESMFFPIRKSTLVSSKMVSNMAMEHGSKITPTKTQPPTKGIGSKEKSTVKAPFSMINILSTKVSS